MERPGFFGVAQLKSVAPKLSFSLNLFVKNRNPFRCVNNPSIDRKTTGGSVF